MCFLKSVIELAERSRGRPSVTPISVLFSLICSGLSGRAEGYMQSERMGREKIWEESIEGGCRKTK